MVIKRLSGAFDRVRNLFSSKNHFEDLRKFITDTIGEDWEELDSYERPIGITTIAYEIIGKTDETLFGAIGYRRPIISPGGIYENKGPFLNAYKKYDLKNDDNFECIRQRLKKYDEYILQ